MWRGQGGVSTFFKLEFCILKKISFLSFRFPPSCFFWGEEKRARRFLSVEGLAFFLASSAALPSECIRRHWVIEKTPPTFSVAHIERAEPFSEPRRHDDAAVVVVGEEKGLESGKEEK